jgi:hypothetical protein
LTPIAIVTRNRHAYLDVTLRSLSGTRLPRTQIATIFDDASDDPGTKAYLYGSGAVDLRNAWPRDRQWKRAGLGAVESRERGRGIAGTVEVVRLGDKSQGVVNASCAAMRFLLENCDTSAGMVLLQDDVVFREDWLEAIRAAVASCGVKPPGLIAGMRLNVANPVCESPTFIPRKGLTAQCYFVTPAGVDAVRPWVYAPHRGRRRFDNSFCAAIRRAGLGVYLMYPPVCQHIGLESLVRPEWDWRVKSPRGRVDLDAVGPFVVADEVRRFAPAIKRRAAGA